MITFAIKLDAIMASKQQMHPLLVSDELINERGLMVFDDIHQMPIYHEPYIVFSGDRHDGLVRPSL